MLAMVVNDDAGNLTPRSALESIASRLAPTEEQCPLFKNTRGNHHVQHPF
ncbi:hypothetical protein PMI35_00684 [Pseudomonas sp. GM78]|nr:hypothetical protein PMI35_00684 [Pseudomonas sp. GM78]